MRIYTHTHSHMVEIKPMPPLRMVYQLGFILYAKNLNFLLLINRIFLIHCFEVIIVIIFVLGCKIEK